MSIAFRAPRSIFNCYIDELGDEGLSPSSKEWFVLAALVVREDTEEALVRGFEDECKRDVWLARGHAHAPMQIHFRNLSHSQRVAVARVLAQKPFTQIVAAFLKPRLDKKSGFSKNETFYRYATRYLVERVSWYVDDMGGWARLVFSNRRCFRIRELIDYIMLLTKTDTEVRPVFSDRQMTARNADTNEMLRAADVVASSHGCALNVDDYGVMNHQAADELIHHYYRYRNKRVWSYGFKAFPCTRDDLAKSHPHTVNWLK